MATEVIRARLGPALAKEVADEIERHNAQPCNVPMTESDFVRAALAEYLRKRAASRRRRRVGKAVAGADRQQEGGA